MGHMKHSTKAVLIAEDKRAFEQFGLSEGVRRLKANCIEGFGRYAHEGHIGEDRNNRQGNLTCSTANGSQRAQRAHHRSLRCSIFLSAARGGTSVSQF